MGSIWDRALAANPLAPVLHVFDQSLSYAEIDHLAQAFGRSLASTGLEPGDRVGILLQNDPQWPVALLGTWMAGGIAVPLNPMCRPRELRHLLDDAGIRFLVSLADLHRRAGAPTFVGSTVERIFLTQRGDLIPGRRGEPTEALPEAPDVVWLRDELARHRDGQRPTGRTAPDDVALLTYTSGTTGPPKGAMTTHANVAHNARLAALWFGLDADDVIGGIAPLFHITGIVLHMALAWACGSPLVLFHRFDPGAAARWYEHWGVTFSVASITAYIAMLDHPDFAERDLSRLTKVASGGAPISPAIVDRWEAATGTYVHNVYGLTETTSPSHLTPLGRRSPVDIGSGALSIGLPAPGTVARILDLTDGQEQPPGQPVGVPDDYRGETVKAFVALRAGHSATPDEVIFFCRERLAAYKYPRQVEILDELLKTATGKHLRRVLREQHT